jgi:hypothetical protein
MFVAAGLRSLDLDESSCRLPLTDSLRTAAQTLLKNLEAYANAPSTPSGPPNDDDDSPTFTNKRFRFDLPSSLLSSFQEYFFLSVTSSTKSAEDKQFACPVQVFLACFGYNKDDTFKMPSEVTSHLAGWQYLLRCTALFQAVQLERSKKVDSALR